MARCCLAVAVFMWTAAVASGRLLRSARNVAQEEVENPVIGATVEAPAPPAKNSELRNCLAGKNIVFVGPSTSRYEYLALAYFLEYGKWPESDVISFGDGGRGPNPLWERNVLSPVVSLPLNATSSPSVAGCIGDGSGGNSWESFYRYTNGLFNGREVCDCYRRKGTLKYVTENRMYRARNGATLSYFQWHGLARHPRGMVNAKVFNPDASRGAGPLSCPVGQRKRGGKWAFDVHISKFIWHVVRTMKPTHLVVASSAWKVPGLNWNALAKAGVHAVQATGGTAYWRTRTIKKSDDSSKDVDRFPSVAFARAGWELFPARAVIRYYQSLTGASDKQVFIDHVHTKPRATVYLAKTFIENAVCQLY